jgi:hypothetical protein
MMQIGSDRFYACRKSEHEIFGRFFQQIGLGGLGDAVGGSRTREKVNMDNLLPIDTNRARI